MELELIKNKLPHFLEFDMRTQFSGISIEEGSIYKTTPTEPVNVVFKLTHQFCDLLSI